MSEWASQPDHPFRAIYARAREAHGEAAAAAVAQIASKVLEGRYDPKRAWAAGKLLQWTAERYAPALFGRHLDVTARIGPAAPEAVIALPAAGVDELSLESMDPGRRVVVNEAAARPRSVGGGGSLPAAGGNSF